MQLEICILVQRAPLLTHAVFHQFGLVRIELYLGDPIICHQHEKTDDKDPHEGPLCVWNLKACREFHRFRGTSHDCKRTESSSRKPNNMLDGCFPGPKGQTVQLLTYSSLLTIRAAQHIGNAIQPKNNKRFKSFKKGGLLKASAYCSGRTFPVARKLASEKPFLLRTSVKGLNGLFRINAYKQDRRFC